MLDKDELAAGLTPAERELEAALRTLRPTPARIGRPVGVRDAGQTVRGFWNRARSSWAAAAAIVAIGLAWVAHIRPVQDSAVAPPSASTPTRPADVAIPISAESSTLLTYRAALAQSPAMLDALLDEQAVVAVRPRTNSAVTDVSAVLWTSGPRSPLGDM